MTPCRTDAQKLNRRIKRNKAHYPAKVHTKPVLDDSIDPYQRREVFAPAERVGDFHKCGNGYRRGPGVQI